ncbi:MAG: choline ABC transporter ATP-binding protein [Pseudomonadota bacterium]
MSTAPHPAIVFETVSIAFGTQPASALPAMDRGLSRAEVQAETGQVLGVHDCTLTVGQGEIVVLMGLSGSGKSTLLRAVNALNPVTRGRVLIDGGTGMEDVTNAEARTLRRLRSTRVAMVFQQFGLLPWRNVLDNVALGLEFAGLTRRARDERARAQLALVGLDGWAERKVAELSGGMQQRVGLARALVGEAPILLMDEPFSALDPLIRTRLQDELLELQARLKRTIVFVSHDLDEAFKLGDRIAIMEGGRIVQCGTPQDIVTRPADAYVAAFVANLNPLTVLTAAEIMNRDAAAIAALPADAATVEAGTRAVDMARLAAEAEGPLRVVAEGAAVGTVSRADLLRAIAGARPG